MTAIERRAFTPGFKLEIAQLVLDQGYSVREASTVMDVGKMTIDRWVRQLTNERHGITDHPNALTPGKREIQELKMKNKRLELEKEILKNATALLMSGSMRNLR